MFVDSRQVDPATMVFGEMAVSFDVAADTLGVQTLEVFVQPFDREVNVANNTRRSLVNVVEQTSRKVLLYSQVIHSDFGKIRSALERDKKIHLEIGLDAIVNPVENSKVKHLTGHVEWPTNKEGFYVYDLIVTDPQIQ